MSSTQKKPKEPKGPFLSWLWKQTMNKIVIIFTTLIAVVICPGQMYLRGEFFTEEGIDTMIFCGMTWLVVNLANLLCSYFINYRKEP